MLLTHISASKQLSIASSQLETTQNIETAKLIAQYSEMILVGDEKEAQLAQIAFASVPMSEIQRQAISTFLDRSSDSGVLMSESVDVNDNVLTQLLQGIFSENESVRKSNYASMHSYFSENIDEQLIDEIYMWIRENEFNINGRSNVLSIFASIPADTLKLYAATLNAKLDEIMELEGGNPAFAIGPKTIGWIDEIKAKI